MNWYQKIAIISVLMTKAESYWAEWALDPMWDLWCTESGAWERDGEIYLEMYLPRIMGNSLILSDVEEINEDLLYRLEEQAPDVSYTDSISDQQEIVRSRAALSLSKKIRNIL